MEQTQPSKMKYIGAWLLAGFLSNILLRILDNVIANVIVQDLSDLNTYFIVVSAVSVPIVSGIFIFVYNRFSSLNIKKVMVYLYVLGGLATLVGMASTFGIYKDLGVDLTVYAVSTISAVIASLYIVGTLH